ncbi:hypothetical protein D3C85_1753360 [compost metagenome]
MRCLHGLSLLIGKKALGIRNAKEPRCVALAPAEGASSREGYFCLYLPAIEPAAFMPQ